jgi:hypothetical protein
MLGNSMKYLVKNRHNSNYPIPIRFQVGDRVLAGKTDDDFPGWIWVTSDGGNQGWAPIQYLKIDETRKEATALHPYSAQELNTRIGDVVTLHYELNGWGWVENEDKDCGWVPLGSIQPDEHN